MSNDPWFTLRRFTQARIAQGRAGSGLPSSALLDFQLAHAAARDAVLQTWDVGQFALDLEHLGQPSVCLASAVSNRAEYLQRPDRGRCLDVTSNQILMSSSPEPVDVVVIVSNGLSSTAVDVHGLSLLQPIISAYKTQGFSLAPICLLPNARVAVADEIGALLQARLAVIIIGERPGLSAADSLGIYLTYAPKVGNTDAERNCLSNIRPPEGMSYQLAADKLIYLSREALRRGLSGVGLKDDMVTALGDVFEILP